MTTISERVTDLRSTGLRVTTARVSILSVFEKSSTRHLTADDVFRLLLKDSMDIGLATVYRVLTQFEQAGILLRRNFESGKAVYELNDGQQDHDHMVCIDCGNVQEFVDPEIEKRQHSIARERGFVVRDHSLTLYGSCQECSKK